jgi:dihydrofolate reductase
MARTITFSAACTLDGYIARTDFSFDWILHGDESREVLGGYWKTIDTILMGRKTWEVAVRAGHGGGHAGIETCVFSRTLPPSEKPGLRVVSDDVVAFVRKLKRFRGKGIFLMGGGELARPLFEAGLVDEIGLNVHPVLLGDGVRLFHRMNVPSELDRIDCRPFRNGCVYVRYAVRGRNPAGAGRRKRG